MKKHIVCFGDSNTHGYCAHPGDTCSGVPARFDESERWPCLLEKALGDGCKVFEEGLSGRTTVFEDPLHEGLSGLSAISPCLMTHEPVDLLIVMLGTNDTKERFAASAGCIAIGMERLLKKAETTECWAGKPNLLLVAPPPIGKEMEETGCGATMGKGCAAKAEALAALYEACARRNGWHFLDARGCAFNEVDYMHLTKKGHAQLAQRLAELVPSIV